MQTTPPLTRSFGTPLLHRAVSGDRRVWFRLVTRDVDRHGTIIEPAGVVLTSHKQNPVFLWMHDSGGSERKATPSPDVVIGHVTDYDQTVDHLDIEVEFDDDGPQGLATKCYRKVKRGLLRMVSIGCNVLAETLTRIGEVDVPTFTQTELLECSLVIIGSNRQALKLDRAAAAEMVSALKDDEDDEDEDEDEDEVERTAAIPSPRQVASIAVFDAAGRMLWGRRRDSGKWTTPGGHLNAGESPVDGAVRELKEETGIAVAASSLQAVGSIQVADDLVVHAFRLDTEAITPGRSFAYDDDPDAEVSEWVWICSAKGDLPPHIRENLHASKNALIELGVFRSLDAGTGFVLDTKVDKTLADDDDFDLFDEDDDVDSDGLVVKFQGGFDEVEEKLYLEASRRAALGHTLGRGTWHEVQGKSEFRLSIQATRGVVPHKNFPLVETAWNADAAVQRWRKWASRDGSGKPATIDWKRYAECFLWFDDAAPEDFSSYKFLHHDIRDGKPVTVWQGVVAAAARIDQVKGIPVDDIVKMKAHLDEHYHEFDKKAPWERENEKRTLDVDLTISASAKSEMRLGIERSDEAASAATRSLLAAGTWTCDALRSARKHFAAKPSLTSPSALLHGGGAGQRDVGVLIAKLRNAEDLRRLATAWGDSDPNAVHALHASLKRSHNAAHYLQAQRPVTRFSEPTPMKRSPEARQAYRGMIFCTLELAEMYQRAVDDGLVADESRTAMQTLSMRALDIADELCGIMHTGLDAESRDASGVEYAASVTDGEVKTRFAEIATKAGKLPRSLRSIVKAELGTEDSDVVEEKLMGFKTDRSNLVELRKAATESQARLDRSECEKAIDEALTKRLICPADAARMRGVDAATRTAVSDPWPRSRVERFIGERAELGPIAEIARPGEVRGLQQSITPSAQKPSLIRTAQMPAPATEQDINTLAQHLAARVGLDPAAILRQAQKPVASVGNSGLDAESLAARASLKQ